jgi:excisionase family DNA binding protein
MTSPQPPALSAPGEQLLTLIEVARYLRLEPETVRSLARRQHIPAIKVGRLWRFRPQDVEAWLERQSKGE